MVRDEADHSGSSGVSVSSIALLQERFRHLQRMKELRQKREVMRSLSESERCSSHAPANRRHRASPPPAPAPARQHCQLALSLWPDSHAKQAESWTPSDLPKPYHSPTCHFPQFNLQNSDTDVDTSLRL